MTQRRPAMPVSVTRGFTLIELLIAMTLLALMTLVLVEALQLATRTWRGGDGARVETADDAIVRDWLRRTITEAQPVMVRGEDDRFALAFRGEPGALRFVAPLPAHLAGGGLSWIALGIADTTADKKLVLGHGLFHPDVAADATLGQRVLLEGIDSVRFGYFGSKRPNDAGAWHDAWVDVDHLPTLVRIQITFAAGGRRPWTPLTIVPMADASRPAAYRAIVAAAGAQGK